MPIPDGMRKPTPRHLTRLEDDRSRFEQKTERFFRLFVDATFTTVHGVGSDVEIPHKAGVIPSAAIPAFPSADARIWKGDTEWTQKYIYLQASAACTSTIFLVI